MKSLVLVLLVTVIAFALAEETCKQGDTKTGDDGCNQCHCGPKGEWFCTQMACPSHHHHRRDVAKECEPGDVKDESCNKCRCVNGQFACTRRICEENRQRREVNTPENCTPGARFMDKCNRCTCSPDGKSAFCTLKACP